MKYLIRIVVIICSLAVLSSLIPVIALYMEKSRPPYSNGDAIGKLEENKGERFAFIVFGDNHAGLIFNDSATLKMIGRMNREDRFKKVPIDLVLALGDITNRGSAWDFRIYDKIRNRITWPVISAFGNHDDDKGGEYFKKHIGRDELSFADRNAYFIVLNNASNDLTEQQFAWLEEELKKASSYPHRFIITHKTPLSPYRQSWYRPEMSTWSYRFMKLCEIYKVDMVFSGHEHMFKKQTFGGVKYIVSGGGGMLTHLPTPEGGFLHYLVVRVYGDYVDYEIRRTFPPLWEFLVYYLWKDLFYTAGDILF